MGRQDRVSAILNAVRSVKRIAENKWMFCCPVHDDRTPSATLTINNDGNIALSCFGCSADGIEMLRTLGLETALLFEDAQPANQDPPPHCTIDMMVAHSGLSRSLLERCGWADATYNGAAAVRVPYYGPDGFICNRWRIRTSGGGKYRWDAGATPKSVLYMGQYAPKSGEYAILVEGETDTISLRANGFNAFGVAGAAMLGPDNSAMLKHYERVYVWREDVHGDVLVSSATELIGADKVLVIKPSSDVKMDANQLLKDLGDIEFRFAVQEMMNAALKPSKGVRWVEDIKPENVEPIVPGYLYRGKLSIIAGAPGAGKTTFVANMVYNAMCGSPFLGAYSVKSRVCWVDRDDSMDRLLVHMFGEYGPIPERMLCVPDAMREVNIDESTEDAWVAMLKGNDIDVLVLDTLKLCSPAASSEVPEGTHAQTTVNILKRIARRAKVGIVGITHATKASSMEKRQTIAAIAGATEWAAGVDVVILMRPCTDDDSAVDVSCPKNRFGDSNWEEKLYKVRRKFMMAGTVMRPMVPEERVLSLMVNRYTASESDIIATLSRNASGIAIEFAIANLAMRDIIKRGQDSTYYTLSDGITHGFATD